MVGMGMRLFFRLSVSMAVRYHSSGRPDYEVWGWDCDRCGGEIRLEVEVWGWDSRLAVSMGMRLW